MRSFRFRYWTDVAATEPGFQVDQIAVGGQTTVDSRERHRLVFAGFRTDDRLRAAGVQELLHRREPALLRQRHVAQDGLQLRVPRHEARLGRELSGTRTACSSPTGTRRRTTTTWASIPAPAWCCRWMRTRPSTTRTTAISCDRGSLRTTRRSTPSRARRSRSTRTASPSRSRPRPRSRCSTTRRTTGSTVTRTPARADTSAATSGWNGVRVPKTGTKIQVVNSNANGFMQIQVEAP